MSIARRFQHSHHWPYRVGDAAVSTPSDPSNPNLSPADQRASETASGVGGFLAGAVVGAVLCAIFTGPGKHD